MGLEGCFDATGTERVPLRHLGVVPVIETLAYIGCIASKFLIQQQRIGSNVQRSREDTWVQHQDDWHFAVPLSIGAQFSSLARYKVNNEEVTKSAQSLRS